MSLELHDDRIEQLLRRGSCRLVRGLESLVQHTLVPCVHIHQNQAFVRLRKDVYAVELSERYP